MGRAQRVAVLVGILGMLVAGALLFIPISYKVEAGRIYGGANVHCGAPVRTVFNGHGNCYSDARDRVTIAAVTAGVSILGAGAAVWLLAPEKER